MRNPSKNPGSKRKLSVGRYTRLDTLVSEFLERVEADGELRLRKQLCERYGPVGPLEQGLISGLALVSWRIYGCEILEDGIMYAVAAIFENDALSALGDPALQAQLPGYHAMLAGHADKYRQQLDRYADFRKRTEAEAAARLQKLQPCTSVIQ